MAPLIILIVVTVPRDSSASLAWQRCGIGPPLLANWLELRSSWETGHAIRFVLQLAALSLLLLSVLFDCREKAISHV